MKNALLRLFCLVLFLAGISVSYESAGQVTARTSKPTYERSDKDKEPKDRNYWQKKKNRKKLFSKKKKKDCDCPGQMTEKQRRKYRVQ